MTYRCPEDAPCENEGGGYDGETFEEDGRSDEGKEYIESFCSSDSGESSSDAEEEEEEEEGEGEGEETSVHCHEGSLREKPLSARDMLQGEFSWDDV